RWGTSMDDIVQQGNLGLLKAAMRFDPDCGCRLVTYASYWIRAEIREYVVRGYRIVRMGTTKAERRALRLYRQTRESDPARLAASSGISVEHAERILPMLSAYDVPLEAGSETHPSAASRIASRVASPEDEVSDRELRERTREAFEALLAEATPRDRRIARSR